MTGPDHAAPTQLGRHSGLRNIVKRSREPMAWAILFIDIALILLFGLLTDGIFLQVGSLQALAVNSAEVVLLAVGAAIVLAMGEIDISLGAVLIASSVASGLAVAGLPETTGAAVILSVGLAVAVLAGMICAALSAFCILVLRVNSFITTLAMLGILTGTVYVITNGSNLTGIPIALQEDFGSVRLAGAAPLPAVIAIAAALAVWFVLRKTRFGVHVLACGSSRSAAERAGVAVTRTVFWSFVIVGALCGIAGFIDLGQFGTTDVSGHQADALAAIAGAVIGGTRLSGGRVTLLGAVAGALLASILQIGLVVAGLQSFYQLIVVGLILIAAVAIGQRRQARTAR